MRQNQRFMAATFTSVVVCLVQLAVAGAPKESLMGMWRITDENGMSIRVIKLGDIPEVPPDLLADLAAFNASLAVVPEHLRYIAVSPNGRAFGIAHSPTSDEPTGIWIWPNWRESSPTTFPDFSYFEFLSNSHVYLSYRGPDTPLQSRIAAIGDPETLHSLPGVSRSALRVLDDGRWASTSTESGQLLVGELDPENVDAGADEAVVVPFEFEGSIENLAWGSGGDFIIVEIVDNDGSRTLKVFDTDSFEMTDTVDGWMYSSRGQLLGQDHFYGGYEDDDVVYRLLPTGQLEWQSRAFAQDEDPANWSPSGWFTTNYQRVGVGIHETKIRRTVLADPDAPLPTWPTHEVDGNEQLAGRYLWLAWE